MHIDFTQSSRKSRQMTYEYLYHADYVKQNFGPYIVLYFNLEIAKLITECETLTHQFLNLKIEKKRIKPPPPSLQQLQGTCKICGAK